LSGLQALPVLSELIPGGIEYGTILLVEFEPDSLWYETSLTAAFHALKGGVRTDYHTWTGPPDKIRDKLTRFGLDVKKLEDEDALRIIDSYTIQTGTVVQDKSGKARVPWQESSLKVADLSIASGQEIKTHTEADRRRLHLDDNSSISLQYNDEKVWIDTVRSRFIQRWKSDELVLFVSFMVAVHSPGFYKHLESLFDGILDFRSEQAAGQVGQFARVRVMRGMPCDSKWRRLRLMENGEVALGE
jgi:KaiC/GvpD/RAD55 family RecA-like ATPase